MKRINPTTNQPFKRGDVREDGRVFKGYITTRVKKNGLFVEEWLTTKGLKKYKNTVNLSSKNWYLSNTEKAKEIRKKHFLNNPEQYAARNAKRRAAQLQRTPKWLTADDRALIADYYQMAKDLESIFPWKQHVDHILPLQGKKVSGLHTPLNLQILSESANLQKSNKAPI